MGFGFGIGHPPLAGRQPQLADFPGKVGKGACTYFDPPPREGNADEQSPINFRSYFVNIYVCQRL